MDQYLAKNNKKKINMFTLINIALKKSPLLSISLFMLTIVEEGRTILETL
jgi:hypothetical protein